MNKMEIDKNTGLPRLPEGEYWEVVASHTCYYLKWKNSKWLSNTVASEPITNAIGSVIKEIDFVDVRGTAIEMWEAEQKKEKSRTLLGQYPPKSGSVEI